MYPRWNKPMPPEGEGNWIEELGKLWAACYGFFAVLKRRLVRNRTDGKDED
jgi:hypothetical protein